MKMPLSMLKRFTEIELSPEEYASRMIMSGTEVESVTDLGEEIENVVVGRVLTCEGVEGTHLHQCTVDVGGAEPLHIVCGAPNVAAGALVPVALDGARLPGGVKIKKGKLRGMVSEGMLCSAAEIKVPADLYPNIGEEGLLLFAEEYPLGADVRPILGLDDQSVNVEILANRPDCLSAVGLARESAAVLSAPFRAPELSVTEAGGDIASEVSVRVDDAALCPRYAARVIKNVRVAPSPLWLRKALHAAGLRSINNIVDITNYIMLEYGHPMHAFDLAKVRGRTIIVRRAHEGETLKTLDGEERPLRTDDLVICDELSATGLAGVMGGEESEITEATREVMFECASFDRAAIRLTSRRMGLRTESSARFERGVSPRTVMEALDRACHLVNELDAGDVVSGAIDLYPDEQPPRVVHGSVRRIAQRAGVDIPAPAIVDALLRLGFQCELDGDKIEAVVPAWRQDVDGEADLCEEALRLYGYEHIGSTALRGETTQGKVSPMLKLRARLGTLLQGMGYQEVMNYSFLSLRQLEKLGLPEGDARLDPLPLRNPLGEDTAFMRPTLAPGMLRALGFNMSHAVDDARLYELAAVFDRHSLSGEGLPTERMTLCLGAFGDNEDFYTVRGALETLLQSQGVAYETLPGADAYYHPGRCARLCDGEKIYAQLGEVHPDALEAFGLPRRAILAELDVAALLEAAVPMGEIRPLPPFPSVARDLALVMDEATPVGPLMAAMRRAGGKLLESIRMFDVYRDPRLGLGRKSVAFSLVFRAPDRTLTEPEIQKAMDKVVAACETQAGAKVRG